MQNELPITAVSETQSAGEAPAGEGPTSLTAKQKQTVVITLLVLIVVVGLISLALYYLLTGNPSKTEQIRDVFIIILAVQSLLTGMVMVILVLQLARLINLIQNEIRPILDSTSDTINHLRGTTMFLGQNVVEPVIKLNEYMAGFTQLFSTFGLLKKSSKKNNKTGE